MEPTFFATPDEFRNWLIENHKTETELLVGFHKKGSGKPGITWPESVDQAICFGWIDGIRKSLDENSYTIRFTLRKPGSIWSQVNIKKAEELKAQGLMYPLGLAAFEKRDEKKSRVYSFEQKNIKLDAKYQKQFECNTTAWQNFQNMPPSYKKPAIWWVMSAKREETRLSRLQTLIEDSENGLRIKPLRRN